MNMLQLILYQSDPDMLTGVLILPYSFYNVISDWTSQYNLKLKKILISFQMMS